MSWPASSYASDLADAMREWLDATCDKPGENAEYLEGFIAALRRNPDAMVARLEMLLADYRRRAGLCPDCGGALEERRWVEAHGEPWSALVCPEHGEVEAGAVRG